MPVNREDVYREDMSTDVLEECKRCRGRCCRGLIDINVILLVSPDDVKRWLGVDELTFEAVRDGISSGKLPIVFQQVDAAEVHKDGLATWTVRMQLAIDGDRVVYTFGDAYWLSSPCVMWDAALGECKYTWENRPWGCRSLRRLRREGVGTLFASSRCLKFARNYSLAMNVSDWLPYEPMIEQLQRYYYQHGRFS